MSVLDQVKFDDKGLVTAVARDTETGKVVMLAYMNRESLQKTIETKIATYWSRSRQKLWIKGESSGHVQKVHHLYLDCDGDALLIDITQEGAACHKGYFSCFFREITDLESEPTIVEERVFDPDKVY
jgi:phosphoribosyl-AMP cyclohydrolase